MKAVSILEPWASLVVHGFKKIETRSWDTKHRGPLLIHASLGKKYKGLPADDPLYKHYHQIFAKDKIPPIEQLPYGAIIGKVNLENVVKFKENEKGWGSAWGLGGEWPLSEEERAFGDYTPGRFGWLLSEAVMFAEPIPWQGKLSLWDFPEELLPK